MTRGDTSVPFVDLRAQHGPLKAALLDVVSRAIDDAAFIGGVELSEFETEFARFTECRHAVGVANGTDALRLALLAMGVGPGDAVVTVPNTFVATTAAISQAGAAIEFVDVDPETCLMDTSRLEHHLKNRSQNKRLSVILPVHLYGQCADMDAIVALAGAYDAQVLEDTAQAHGATYKERRAGSLGHAACFSFYAAKNLGACGEAGAVTTNDPEIAKTVHLLRNHGQVRKNEFALEGYNSRLDAIQAGFLRVKLPHVADWNRRRHEIAEIYDRAFDSLETVRPTRVLPHNTSSRHLYIVHVNDRDDLAAFLERRGVATGLHYPAPLHLLPIYSHCGYDKGDFPDAEWSSAHLLSLPIFPEMTEAQVGKVISEVTEWSANRERLEGP